MQKNRDFSLDFIRGIAILVIIFYHYNSAAVRITLDGGTTLFQYNSYAGTIGTTMFFILSGASLFLTTQNNFSLISFYKKRFLSIFPLFWATYILLVLLKTVAALPNPFVDRNPLTFILTILGVDGFFLYKMPNYYMIGEWFLGCVIILYCLFPVIRFLFRKNKHLLLAASFLLCIILENTYNLDMMLNRLPLFRVFEFVFGMYFVAACTNTSAKQNRLYLLFSTTGITVLFLSGFAGSLSTLNSVMGILFFVSLSTLVKLCEKHIPRKPINFLSTYSYAAFLLHHVILFRILTYANNSLLLANYNWPIFFFTLFIVYLFSYVFYSSVRILLRNSISI